jgi:hypothetical protein
MEMLAGQTVEGIEVNDCIESGVLGTLWMFEYLLAALPIITPRSVGEVHFAAS